MPKYKVITDVGESDDGDDEPLEFPTQQDACNDAQMALAEMAKERMPLDGDRHFGVKIYDDSGRAVYSASLDFSTDSKNEPAPDVATQLPSGQRE